MATVIVQAIVLIVLAVIQGSTDPVKLRELSTSSLLLSSATLTSTPILIGLVVLLIYLRGCSIRDYLAWKMPSVKQTLLAIGGLAILLIAGDLVTYLLGRPIVPVVMIDIYKTGYVIPLMISVMIAAPLGEEVLFRGFVYRGIAASRWGSTVAIVLSSIGWAALHIQYDLYVIGVIVLMGFYQGFVRKLTGSLPLNMLLHCIANVVATVEMIVVVESQGG